ncbi:MAG: class I fructose-bisphosphate aldolase [Elusimicrobia bacterium]|nr:class I fructose-bisphosphate aldolase [Elusimicrobiota bacterium]
MAKKLSPRVKKILDNFPSENRVVLGQIERIFNAGRLSGTGKVVILPVDQGFEHGPARSFAKNPAAYDPLYHAGLALEAGLNAYAAPLGQMEHAAKHFAKKIPLILKVNSSDSLKSSPDPIPALTASAEDAKRLGCAAVGFTIYPGSGQSKQMYEEAADVVRKAKAKGLVAIVWSYPRGGGLSKEGETAIDVVAYAAHIACQMGAHLVKVKPPTAFLEKEDTRRLYGEQQISVGTLADRVRHVVQASFNGCRPVIFSGGPSKSREEILSEIREIHAGGGFGSIIGRNAFQRPKAEALSLLSDVVSIYKN